MEQVVKAMAEALQQEDPGAKPIIMPLSNPSKLAEAKQEDVQGQGVSGNGESVWECENGYTRERKEFQCDRYSPSIQNTHPIKCLFMPSS